MKTLSLSVVSLFLAAGACAQQPFDYALGISGPKTVYAGSDLYVKIHAGFKGTNPKTHMYFLGVESLPSGASYELWCSDYQQCWVDTKRKISYMYQGTNATTFRLRTTPNTPPGAYNIVVKTENSGLLRQVNIPVNVVLAPLSRPSWTLGTAPSIAQPVVAKWETSMLQLASKWCKTPDQTMSFGVESQVWYYDGARVYFQIADYTKNPQWEACAINIAKQYRDYVMANKGLILGSRVFPQGLYMAWQRTKDPSFKDALVTISQKGTWASKGGSIDETSIRETSYILQTYVFAERAGAGRHPLMDRSVSYLLGHFDVLFNGGDAKIHQTFYDGLGAHALIDYYELTGDPRVPAVMKTMLDWIYLNMWNPQSKTLLINPEPMGAKCAWGCREPNTDLINLTVPAFAWYARVTGDLLYQKRGDEIFSASLNTDITYSGKIFSQNYRWPYPKVRK